MIGYAISRIFRLVRIAVVAALLLGVLHILVTAFPQHVPWLVDNLGLSALITVVIAVVVTR